MYGIEIRRELHMHPELRFDLPYTLGVVRRELNRFGIPFSEAYGRSSIVATLAEDQPGKALAIRADMDALPIAEANCVPYKSLNEGKMHACGHDVHTAVLLRLPHPAEPACHADFPGRRRKRRRRQAHG